MKRASKKGSQVSTKRVAAPIAAKVARVSVALSHDDIARRAFELYMDEGQPEGRHVQHWLRAESELRG